MTDIPERGEHTYLSTACFHGEHDQCRATCKYCPAQCVCDYPECDHSVVPMSEPYQVGEKIEFQEPRTDLWVDATVVGHDEYGGPQVAVPRREAPFAPDSSKLRRRPPGAQ